LRTPAVGEACWLCWRRFPILAGVRDDAIVWRPRLAAIVCGLLTGARGYKAIAQWTRVQGPSVWAWLGFTRKPPCPNSFRNLLLALEPATLESVLQRWMETLLDQPLPDEARGTSLDGKTLCNTLTAHERNVHLLSLLDQQLGGVHSQQAVDPTTNEAKASLELLKTVVLQGRLVSADAMFCRRKICQQIVDSGGDYLMVVKDNQPELKLPSKRNFSRDFLPRPSSNASSRCPKPAPRVKGMDGA